MMQKLITDLQESLSLSHIYNNLINYNKAVPYYLPTSVANLFQKDQHELIIVQFNKVILFGQIKINDYTGLVIGPLTTQNLFYSLPFEAFSYLQNNTKFQKLKNIIDQQANFSMSDFDKLLRKLGFFVLKKNLIPQIFKRNDYHEDAFVEVEPSQEILIKDFHSAISHGDTHRIKELTSYPQTYLTSFIHKGNISKDEMRRQFYQSLITTSNLAIFQGVSLNEIEPIQKRYYRLWQSVDLTPIKAGHIMLSSILEITELIKKKRFLSPNDPIINYVYNYIDHYYQRPLSRRDIAKALNISPSYLSEHIKKKTGNSLTYFIQSFKIKIGRAHV